MTTNKNDDAYKDMCSWISNDEDYLPEPPNDFIRLSPPHPSSDHGEGPSTANQSMPSDDHARGVVDWFNSSDDYLPGPPDLGAPHPAEGGVPEYDGSGEYVPGDDDAEALPSDLDADEMRKVDPAVIESCATLDQNDHGNAKRLLLHFEHELLNVREIGWHRFLGTHWEPNGGRENAIDLAQRAAQRIVLEADFMTATPVELQTIEKGEQAARELKTLRRKAPRDWTDDDKARAEILDAQVMGRKMAIDALKKRQINRRKFAVSSGNMSRSLSMLAAAEPHRTVAPEALDTDPLAFNVRNGTLRFVKQPDSRLRLGCVARQMDGRAAAAQLR